jgi:hypothetical protein
MYLVLLGHSRFSIRSGLTVRQFQEPSRIHEVEMSTAYSMLQEDAEQTGQEHCFVGGKPKLPPGSAVPRCKLCGAEQTFFFQVAFPDDHAWAGLTLAVFACTSCADENSLIPEMLAGALPGANIPKNFLEGYQKNFRFEVFQTTAGRIANDYHERIRFRRIRFGDGNGSSLGQIGGTPTWVLEDESPYLYDSTTPMCFLLQVSRGINFETVDGAPRQMEIGLSGDQEPSPYDFYQLFIGNAVYMFGTKGPPLYLVYAITQAS